MAPRDMTGTARCGSCGNRAVHERGPGSPLVIRHADGCPEGARGLPPATCMECGCTELDCSRCIEITGVPCHWADDQLCSRCAGNQ